MQKTVLLMVVFDGPPCVFGGTSVLISNSRKKMADDLHFK